MHNFASWEEFVPGKSYQVPLLGQVGKNRKLENCDFQENISTEKAQEPCVKFLISPPSGAIIPRALGEG